MLLWVLPLYVCVCVLGGGYLSTELSPLLINYLKPFLSSSLSSSPSPSLMPHFSQHLILLHFNESHERMLVG